MGGPAGLDPVRKRRLAVLLPPVRAIRGVERVDVMNTFLDLTAVCLK
ncbi:MAG: hypothetical protein ACRDNP_01700 [Gaiellaceae bacterium]